MNAEEIAEKLKEILPTADNPHLYKYLSNVVENLELMSISHLPPMPEDMFYRNFKGSTFYKVDAMKEYRTLHRDASITQAKIIADKAEFEFLGTSGRWIR